MTSFVATVRPPREERRLATVLAAEVAVEGPGTRTRSRHGQSGLRRSLG